MQYYQIRLTYPDGSPSYIYFEMNRDSTQDQLEERVCELYFEDQVNSEGVWTLSKAHNTVSVNQRKGHEPSHTIRGGNHFKLKIK